MTGPEATPSPEASGARGLVLTDLIGRLARAVTEGIGRYEVAARQADGALLEGLVALGRAKRAQAAELAPLARALGVGGIPVPPDAAGRPPAPAWGVVLAEAFQAERALEQTASELTALATDPQVKALGARLASGAAAQGREVRKLYLRYS